MKKFFYNSTDKFIKTLLFVVLVVHLIFLFSAALISKEIGVKMIVVEGRSVLIVDNETLSKKRALDEALYLASLRGGAKVNGFSSIDEKTTLKESLVVRPSSHIIDFKILEEKKTDTHFLVKIQAAVINNTMQLSCENRNNKKINVTFFQPHVVISSNLPAWSQKIPKITSEAILENLKKIKEFKITDAKNFFIQPSKMSRITSSLDYASLTEENVTVKNGDFSVITNIEIYPATSRLHRFSDEIVYEVSLDLYMGQNFRKLETFNYQFSLELGNKTGYKYIDSFYKTSYDKIVELTNKSLSRFHFRVLDHIKCMPLEARILFRDSKLIVDLGSEQGLSTGRVGLVSSEKNMNYTSNDWSVLTVKNSFEYFSELETLNPDVSGNSLDGKIIRFLN